MGGGGGGEGAGIIKGVQSPFLMSFEEMLCEIQIQIFLRVF